MGPGGIEPSSSRLTTRDKRIASSILAWRVKQLLYRVSRDGWLSWWGTGGEDGEGWMAKLVERLLATAAFWVRIQTSRVSDTHWFNADPDPAFYNCGSRSRSGSGSRDFHDQKCKTISTGNFFHLFYKITIYFPLGLHKGLPSYRRSLQPSK